MVDTVYQIDGLKTVELDANTDWNEPMRFIEGVGPNVTIAKWWRSSGLFHPLLVCSFERDTKVYESQNQAFLDCSINTTYINPYDDVDFEIFPNPVSDDFTVRLDDSSLWRNLVISIYSITGRVVYYAKSDNVGYIFNVRWNVEPGIYILSLTSQNRQKTYKIIKQ